MTEVIDTHQAQETTESDVLQDLIDRAMADDNNALGTLYFEVLPSALQAVRRVERNPIIVEDLAASALEKVVRAVKDHAYTTSGPVKGWVYRIGYNVGLDYLKSKDTQTHKTPLNTAVDADRLPVDITADPTAEGALQSIEKSLNTDVVEHLLATPGLSSQSVKCIRLYYLEGLSQEEIAKQLGLRNTQSVKQSIFRGMSVLRKSYNITVGSTNRDDVLSTIRM